MFTTKHYNKIASLVREYGEWVSKEKLVEDLVTFFQQDNPKFNPTLFISACYCEANSE